MDDNLELAFMVLITIGIGLKSDEEKLKNAHKVRTQYPLPPQRKVENMELEITNIKDSIVVTETVYAD